MIVGITGTDGAGKGEVVKYLVEENGFTHYSAREFIIAEIEHRGREVNRDTTRHTANELRKEHGNDVIVQRALARVEADGVRDAVIESIRAVAEAEALQAAGGILLAVDAKPHVRYARIVARGSELDQISFEDFVRQEEIEMNDPDPNGMQKARVMQMADVTIMNDSSLPDLQLMVDSFLANM